MPQSDYDKDDVKKVRRTREVERLLRENLGYDGPKGNGVAYKRGHEFSFGFTDAQRHDVNTLIEMGWSFEDAFDYVKAGPWNCSCGAYNIPVRLDECDSCGKTRPA